MVVSTPEGNGVWEMERLAAVLYRVVRKASLSWYLNTDLKEVRTKPCGYLKK